MFTFLGVPIMCRKNSVKLKLLARSHAQNGRCFLLNLPGQPYNIVIGALPFVMVCTHGHKPLIPLPLLALGTNTNIYIYSYAYIKIYIYIHIMSIYSHRSCSYHRQLSTKNQGLEEITRDITDQVIWSTISSTGMIIAVGHSKYTFILSHCTG